MITSCLLTIWTSTAFQAGDQGLFAGTPNMELLCKVPSEIHRNAECSKNGQSRFQQLIQRNTKNTHSSEDTENEDNPAKLCDKLDKQEKKCESTVIQAYRKVNTFGCSKQFHAYAVCLNTSPACADSPLNRPMRKCLQACNEENQAQALCTRDMVLKVFRKAGLHEDGTSIKLMASMKAKDKEKLMNNEKLKAKD